MAVSQATMAAVMTMTPVHMKLHGHEGTSLYVISLHIAGMYLLSPLVGRLAERAGNLPAVVAGACLLIVATSTAALSGDVEQLLFPALWALGLGWSFGLIGGSGLLVESVPAGSRVAIQGSADLPMVASGSVAGFTSGFVVVGHPKPQSRTREAALMVAEALGGGPPDVVIDVADLGPGLLAWNDPAITGAIDVIRSSPIVVVASPTFKAAYTGMLKLFLDQFPPDGSAGVVAVPMMLGAGPTHALAPELLLKPLLVELGATCPTRGLYMLDSVYASEAAMEPWLSSARPQVLAATSAVV